MSASRIAAALLAPLAAAASAPAPASPVAAPVQVIVLYSHGYQPSPIRLAAGRAVTLHFVNRAGKRHDFTAPAFFGAARALSGNAAGGKVDLAPGASRTVTLVPVAGSYRVRCTRPLHKLLGMKATIVVG
ncbi:MAG TPA: cupredoxin domain-containing protein [Sphingomicrobium sp.]|nr:cupredoxin domain-containing protein [Sphingomicrobium sp.]